MQLAADLFCNPLPRSGASDSSTPLHFLAIGGTGDVLGGAVKALLKQGHRVSLMSRSQESVRAFAAEVDAQARERIFPVVANYSDVASIEKALAAYGSAAKPDAKAAGNDGKTA